MAAPQGVIRYCQQEQRLTFRVEGRGTMAQSLPLRRHAERSFGEGTNQVRIDLRDCTYMDSTFLGTILTLKKALDRMRGQLTLLTPSAACSKILQQMGLGEVLPPVVEDVDERAKWTELACGLDDSGMFRTNVAQAHQELAKLPGAAGEQFQGAMRCLSDADRKAPPGE
jgi:anti-anti-sigma factor